MTVQAYIKKGLNDKSIAKDTFIEVQDEQGGTLGFAEACEMVDNGAAYLNFEYTSVNDKDESGNIIIKVDI